MMSLSEELDVDEDRGFIHMNWSLLKGPFSTFCKNELTTGSTSLHTYAHSVLNPSVRHPALFKLLLYFHERF